MINRIIDILNDLDIKIYKINERCDKSVEGFFIKEDMQMDRIKETKEYMLTIYVDFKENDKKYRGASKIILYPNMSDEEMKNEIEGASYAALLLKNDYYPIVGEGEKIENKLNLKEDEYNLEEDLVKVYNIVYKKREDVNSIINSCEIFINTSKERIVNSFGVDVRYTKYFLEVESISQCNDVEIYNRYKYNSLDEKLIDYDIKKSLELTDVRSKAKEVVKTGKYNIILRDEYIAIFMKYYRDKSNAKLICNGTSDFEIDNMIQGDDVLGSKITLSLDGNEEYTEDGLGIKRENIISKGIVKNYHGDLSYSYYLNIKPTGKLEKIIVGSGDKTLKEMRKQNYVEILSFSDFQMDSITGSFGGEIRLALYYRDNEIIPITGGSISGNILEVQENMYLSKEICKLSSYEGPVALEIKNVNITGL